jgi:predicted RNA-binding protein YlxR (DUF448 family)
MSEVEVPMEKEARGALTPAAELHPEPAASRGRARTCIGCNERVELPAHEGELIRLILGPNGEVAVDPRGGGFGRGAHVHPRRDCLDRAVKRGLARSSKGAVTTLVDGDTTVSLSVDALARAIQAAMDRRIEGLVAAAARSKQVALGADAVEGACQRGDAALVVVACDAQAAAEIGEVRRAVAEGRGVAWGSKAKLAALTGPGRTEGLGVLAVTSGRIAGAIRDAVHAAQGCIASSAPARRENRPARGERGDAGANRPRSPDAHVPGVSKGITSPRSRGGSPAPVKMGPKAAPNAGRSPQGKRTEPRQGRSRGWHRPDANGEVSGETKDHRRDG